MKKNIDFGIGLVEVDDRKEYTKDPMLVEDLHDDDVFIFASNIQGEHMGGSAAFAHRSLGAEWGVGEGLTGRCYAFPTLNFGATMRDKNPEEYTGRSFKVAWEDLVLSFNRLEDCVRENIDKKFYLTKVGLGIAGWSLQEVYSAFWTTDLASLDNFIYPVEFSPFIQ